MWQQCFWEPHHETLTKSGWVANTSQTRTCHCHCMFRFCFKPSPIWCVPQKHFILYSLGYEMCSPQLMVICLHTERDTLVQLCFTLCLQNQSVCTVQVGYNEIQRNICIYFYTKGLFVLYGTGYIQGYMYCTHSVQELSNLYTENVFTTFTISMVQSVLKQIITMLESSICTSSAEKGGRAPCIHFVVIVFCNIAERYIIK